ncbi:MAG: hypothetical protein U5K79_22785 [Cyclobacteriaceae bacterium]|nr:hypothetical protein [Cyclobacteriaceae bacterium]
MENNLDRLFRNKLADHKVTPSDNAWEKLNSQLRQARWHMTQKRLAIAAAVILFMSVIGVTYYYLDTQKSAENPVIAKKVDSYSGKPANEALTEIVQDSQSTINEIAQVNEGVSETVVKPAVPAIETVAKKNHPEPIAEKTEDSETNFHAPQETMEESPLVAQAIMESPETSKIPASETVEDVAVISTPVEIPSIQEPMTVTITYKANKNSRLVASQKANVIQEGIEKITGFAEERVFTDELKTKLRNTTEDVLALNFGKLINKQNKEY